MRKVLIYGDSNVWGDNFFTGVRIADEKQWSNILQKKMADVKIIQEGLPGRIAGDEESLKPYKNGKETFLAIFRTAAPVSEIIIALGTNDLQVKYQKNVQDIVDDLLWYKSILEKEFEDEENRKKYFVNEKMPRIIYILPPNFDYNRKDNPVFDKVSEEKRREVIRIFADLDVESVVLPKVSLFSDGIHLDYKGHELVADIIYKMLVS